MVFQINSNYIAATLNLEQLHYKHPHHARPQDNDNIFWLKVRNVDSVQRHRRWFHKSCLRETNSLWNGIKDMLRNGHIFSKCPIFLELIGGYSQHFPSITKIIHPISRIPVRWI